MIRRWVPALLMAVIANWFFLCDAFGPASWLFNLVLLGEFLYFNLRPIEKGESGYGTAVASGIFSVLWAVAAEAILFWNGMLRVYVTSVQLGLKHRILGALCGWIPVVNLWYLTKMIRIVSDEVEFEMEKWELDEARAESEVCKTRYPILMVHGVFFRDYRYINYWGRIPRVCGGGRGFRPGACGAHPANCGGNRL